MEIKTSARDFYLGLLVVNGLRQNTIILKYSQMLNSPLPNALDKPNGLHIKYFMQRIVGYTTKRKPIYVDIQQGEEFFVLRLDEGCKDKNHLAACKVAAKAYMDYMLKINSELVTDMKKRYGL